MNASGDVNYGKSEPVDANECRYCHEVVPEKVFEHETMC